MKSLKTESTRTELNLFTNSTQQQPNPSSTQRNKENRQAEIRKGCSEVDHLATTLHTIEDLNSAQKMGSKLEIQVVRWSPCGVTIEWAPTSGKVMENNTL